MHRTLGLSVLLISLLLVACGEEPSPALDKVAPTKTFVAPPEFGDADMATLASKTDHEEVILRSVPITDAGLAHLKGMSQLKKLIIADAPITDAGLEHLKGLKNLVMLDLSGTKVTEAGIAELKKALPDAQISR